MLYSDLTSFSMPLAKAGRSIGSFPAVTIKAGIIICGAWNIQNEFMSHCNSSQFTDINSTDKFAWLDKGIKSQVFQWSTSEQMWDEVHWAAFDSDGVRDLVFWQRSGSFGGPGGHLPCPSAWNTSSASSSPRYGTSSEDPWDRTIPSVKTCHAMYVWWMSIHILWAPEAERIHFCRREEIKP